MFLGYSVNTYTQHFEFYKMFNYVVCMELYRMQKHTDNILYRFTVSVHQHEPFFLCLSTVPIYHILDYIVLSMIIKATFTNELQKLLKTEMYISLTPPSQQRHASYSRAIKVFQLDMLQLLDNIRACPNIIK